MKKTFTILFFSVLVLLTGNIFSQVQNLKSMEGPWVGQWVNLYYMSSGSINLTITVNESLQTAHGAWNVGGNIMGSLRDPFTTDITLTPAGFVASFNSPIWGDIAGTGLYTGIYAGVATNCPNPNAQSIVASGTFNNTHISGTFDFVYQGNAINGTVSITKPDPISTPTGLSATENPQGTVNLNWVDVATNETGYRIDRKNTSIGTWSEIDTVGADAHFYADNTIQMETQYTYRIAAYNSLTESEYSDTAIITTKTSVNKTANIPAEFSLLQNYPNPFNPSTVISYDLPRDSRVNISVYSISGEHLATLVNDVQTAGRYEVNYDAKGKASGIYLVKMVAQSLKSGKQYVDYRKMVLIK
ncbi:MAG: T9SS type A sorting domain-containing protein [Bacteroidota bacterium]